MNPVDAFLLAYAHDKLGWSETDTDVIARRLCEEYFYSPKKFLIPHREFLFIFYGWMWGKTGDEVKANCACASLESKMEEIYVIVAKENNWG